MKFSPEVLIYIQTVKKYFKSNKEARDYFINDYDEDQFYNILGEIAQKNLEDNGDAILTKEQFEFLRNKVLNKEKQKDFGVEMKYIDKVFIDFKDYEKICLN
jgi:hypothetical protein